MKLEGKVALVSGSGRGIGREIALKLASEGARIVVNDLDADPAMEAVETLRSRGAEAVACVGSVTEPDFGNRFVKTALDAYGGIDIIVNNAGYTWDSVIQRMTDEQWYAMIDVHMTAPFRILRAASDFIREAAKREIEEGRDVYRKVVNVSSTSGVMGNPGQANYSSAKAGIIGLTKALSKEWGRYRVNVNSVAFGLIKTRLTDAVAGEGASINVAGNDIKVGVNAALMKNIEASIPMGRAGTPEEAAGAVYLLCLPESNYVSGQCLICGGGRP
jgi:3-oxoacyl-[acyl-carrier protein] reductase